VNSAPIRALLTRGMLAGLVAGLLASGFAYLTGESSMNAAIAYEAARSADRGMELVSRSLQATAGLATGLLVFGVATGGIAALAFCFALGRIGRFGPRATAALIAAAAFVIVYLVPFLKYPANPPATSDPSTLNQRTTLYFLMIALSVLLFVGSVVLGRRLAPRLGNWNASLAAGVAFVVTVTLVAAFMPAVSETPKDFPATVMWQFRVAAIGIQAVLWAAFGLLFGYLAERVLAPRATLTAGSGSSAHASVVTRASCL